MDGGLWRVILNPRKRFWQDDPTPDLTGGSDMSTRGSAYPTEAGISEKRARLTHDHLERVLGSQDGSTVAMSTAPPAVDDDRDQLITT